MDRGVDVVLNVLELVVSWVVTILLMGGVEVLVLLEQSVSLQ